MEVLETINYFSIFLTLVYILVVITFIVGWAKIALFKRTEQKGRTSVSIIIAARNEEEKIDKTIVDMLSQSYERALIEVIVIDDHSTDRTAKIVQSYSNSKVKLIQLNEPNAINSYKKKAIETAIGVAKGDLIVTTDADCRMGPEWLATIVNYYEKTGCKMISSPVAYFEEKSFFEEAQALEFAYLIGLGASTIGNKNPSTCNGANLAYEKQAFIEVGGFKGIDDLASGDDELLLHKMAACYPDKIGFVKNEDAIVYTHAKATLGEFIQQRKRWASKSTRYKAKSVMALGLSVWLFNLSIITNVLLVIFFPVVMWPILIFQLLAKLLIEFIFLNQMMVFFKRKHLLWWLPILNALHIVYIVYIGVAGNSGKYNWKGRSVK